MPDIPGAVFKEHLFNASFHSPKVGGSISDWYMISLTCCNGKYIDAHSVQTWVDNG